VLLLHFVLEGRTAAKSYVPFLWDVVCVNILNFLVGFKISGCFFDFGLWVVFFVGLFFFKLPLDF